MNHLQFQTTIGAIALTWNSRGELGRLDWYNTRMPASQFPWADRADPLIPASICSLLRLMKGYFTEGQPMEELPWEHIDRIGWTDFQGKVYAAVASIPHGETRTYSWVASKIGMVSATRAVGQALRRNPIPILIPCHRVVSTTTIGGFMGMVDPELPELQLKNRLIQIEEGYRSPMFSFLSGNSA